tara:strand:+ start:2392 stop:2565 length:174 start_codon:yes stop_codon:yes gene_type:complete
MMIEKDGFWSFCRIMWGDNNREREGWGEKTLSFEDYVEKNEQFLIERFNKERYGNDK